jgi:drug/metabolite transporter (DMT)-like permease
LPRARLVKAQYRPTKRVALSMMIVSSAGFGFTLVAAKAALEYLAPLQILFWTRLVAGATLVPGIGRGGAGADRLRRVALPGLLLGSLLFFCYALQVFGLQYTTASNAGIILGVQFLLTPFAARLLLGERPTEGLLVGAVLCLAGVAVVTGKPGPATVGDMLVLSGALLIPLHTIVVAHWTRVAPARDLIRVQTVVAAVLSLIALLGSVDPQGAIDAAPAVLVGGILGGSIAVTLQATAQRSISAGQTSLLMALEPPFAAVISIVWLGERPGVNVWIGAAIISFGIFLGTRRLARRPPAPGAVELPTPSTTLGPS